MSEIYKLPGSSYEELIKIIRAYAATSKNGAAVSLAEVAQSTGMNRKEFCEYFQIPYRTVTEWERDNRHAPEYVLRLLEYYIRMEKLQKENKKETSRPLEQ